MSGAGPVLLVAPPGGGGEILALCLAQHPAFVVVELPGDEVVLPGGFPDLLRRWQEQTVWATTGVHSSPTGPETLVASEDPSGTQPHVRPVLLGDTFLDDLPALLAARSDAKVLFLVRDVAESAAEVIAHPGPARRAAGGGHAFTPERAGRRWRSTVKRAERIEIAYGSDRVLRLSHRDVLADPEAALTRCFAFLGESFAPGQLMRFRPADSPVGSLDAVRAALPPDLLEFSARLLDAPVRHLPARPERIARLEAQRAEQDGE